MVAKQVAYVKFVPAASRDGFLNDKDLLKISDRPIGSSSRGSIIPLPINEVSKEIIGEAIGESVLRYANWAMRHHKCDTESLPQCDDSHVIVTFVPANPEADSERQRHDWLRFHIRDHRTDILRAYVATMSQEKENVSRIGQIVLMLAKRACHGVAEFKPGTVITASADVTYGPIA